MDSTTKSSVKERFLMILIYDIVCHEILLDVILEFSKPKTESPKRGTVGSRFIIICLIKIQLI